MSILKRLFIVAASAFLALSAHAASPSPCVAGTVASIQATSCTIGNLIFTFGHTHVVDQFGNQSIDTLKFVPLPQSNGFAVKGKWTDTFANSELWILGFGVATIDGSRTISGITVKDFATGDIHFADLTLIDAANQNNTVALQTGYSYPVGCRNPYACSASFSQGPVAAAYDPYYAILEGAIPGGGTVTSYSTQFLINEMAGGARTLAAPVPEPATVALMMAGLVGVVAVARRR